MKKDWMIIESELDEDQIRVLTATLDRSCIVEGCAGSGKSILALIKAQRIQKERGDNYCIIVFTKALCQYMNAGRVELSLNREFEYHYRWRNKKGQPSADYIIVDEIQDFSKEEIEEFIKATNKSFFFFGDTAQSLYDGLRQDGKSPKRTLPVAGIKLEIKEAKDAKSFELYRNYRLPKPVARMVQEVGVGLDPFDDNIYKSKEMAMPRMIKYANEDDQIKAIHRIIHQNAYEDVAILVPFNNDVDRVYKALTKLGGNYEMKCKENISLNFSTTNPKIMTYHSAKGLQFESVFLPFLGTVQGAEVSCRKALYVAMTRTYRNLYMMYSGKLEGVLATILEKKLCATTERDEIEDL